MSSVARRRSSVKQVTGIGGVVEWWTGGKLLESRLAESSTRMLSASAFLYDVESKRSFGPG